MKEKRKIALYGIGTETERAILELEVENDIIGLLDGFRTGGEIYGKNIISMNDAVANGVKRIIVVARPGSCKAIARRIGNQCRESKVELYDIRGTDLLNQRREIYNLDQILESLNQDLDGCSFSDDVKKNLFFNRVKVIADDENGLIIKDAFDVGYLFCAPMITDFVLWLYEKMEDVSLTNMWFGARDGYLIKKLFEILDPSFDSIYFLTSRMVALRAGICNENDLKYVDSMKFSGTLAENLKVRFGIEVDPKVKYENGIMAYKNTVLKRTELSRQGYKRYIDTLHLKAGNIAMFDFVAKGTVQYFLGKLVSNHIKGFYFLQLEPDFMKDKNLDIEPFYTNEELTTSAIFENYYILETILTAPEASVIDFMPDGTPVYANETRGTEDIQCFLKVQDGIVNYFKDYLANCPKEKRLINKKLDEVFLKLIHNVSIEDESFTSLTIEDPFFNRMTAITDVL